MDKSKKATILAGTAVITIGSSSIPIKIEATNSNLIENGIYESLNNDVQIESISTTTQGKIMFTLNKPEQIELKNICILCHGAGKPMTILNMTTNDNKTFELSTAYYKDNTYELYITLPNGKTITKEFSYRYNYPSASKVTATRDSDTTGSLDIYEMNEGGYLYYLPRTRVNTQVYARSYNGIDSKYLKDYGKKVDLRAGFNHIPISNLEANNEYTLYYMMESADGSLSPVYNNVTIGKYKAPVKQEYSLEKVAENKSNEITFNFNKSIENLTINDIKITCPLGKNLTTTGSQLIKSNGGKTWTLIIPDRYQHADNRYTVNVLMPNGTCVDGSFITHFNYPTISYEVLTRPKEDTLKFEFNSDEGGTIYYGLYEWNEEYNSKSNNPKADDILKHKVKGVNEAKLNAGKNILNINLEGHEVTKYTRLFTLYVDYAGNYRIGYADYRNVPKYIPPVIEEKPKVETTLKITDINVFNDYTGTMLDVYFNEPFNSLITKDNFKIESLDGQPLPDRIDLYAWYSPLSVQLENVVLKPGRYKLTIETFDSKGKLVTVSKEFAVN